MSDEMKNEEVKETKEEKIPSMDDFKDELEASYKMHSSGKRADMAQWDKLKDDLDNKLNVEVEIGEAVKGGLTTTLEGIRAFIPASKVALGFVEEDKLKDYIGKRMLVRVITADPEQNKLVLSAKDILREEADKVKAEKAAAIQPGLVTEGTVETIKEYGAFVNIGDGVTGLLHVSQISNKRIKDPSAVLQQGQKVTVMVTAVKDGKISLSMKALEAEKEEKQEKKERENFHENFKGDAALTTSFGDLMKKSGIKF